MIKALITDLWTLRGIMILSLVSKIAEMIVKIPPVVPLTENKA